MNVHSSKVTAMSIAGFDPGSGAGVTADLLTFASHGVFATSAITALTVQSTRGVRRVEPVAEDVLRETLLELEADLPAEGIKLGMLGGAAQVRVVVEFLRSVRVSRPVVVVLDPVLLSSSGAVLLDAAGLGLLRSELLPLVDAVTPNLGEAALLAEMPCGRPEEAEACARLLQARYPQLVPVITGGHWEQPRDLLLESDAPLWLGSERIESRSTHGTGCAYSSALLAGRITGQNWGDAARNAQLFVRKAMLAATPRGSGKGPMHLLSQV